MLKMFLFFASLWVFSLCGEAPSPPPPAFELTTQERVLVEYLVMAEVGGEPYEAQKVVAQVVLDRVVHKKFPDNVYAVVHQKRQFTPVSRGTLRKREPTKNVKQAVEEVFDYGERVTELPLLYFMNEEIADKNNALWFREALSEWGKIGQTSFFIEKN